MATIELSNGCQTWTPEKNTKHPPHDLVLLKAISNAGFVPFTGPGGLCGGKSDSRAVLAIHRGGGAKWEVVFQEHDHDVITTTTHDLGRMAPVLLSWLSGGALLANEDSVYAGNTVASASRRVS